MINDGFHSDEREKSGGKTYKLIGNTIVGGVAVAVAKSNQGYHYREVQAFLDLINASNFNKTWHPTYLNDKELLGLYFHGIYSLR